MKTIRFLAFVAALAAAALAAAAVPVGAQWQTPNHSIPVGRGAGVTGFGSAVPGTTGLPLVSSGASTDPLFQALLTPNVNFTQSGTGAVQRTLDSKLKDSCVSIQDFGGIGDNSTNNVAPLNSALAALSGTGGCIYIPPGKYKFTSAAAFTYPAGIFNVDIRGAGADNTILFSSGAHGLLTLAFNGAQSSAHFSDFTFTTDQVGGQTGIALSLAAALSNPANTASSSFNRVTARGDDGYEVTDFWNGAIALNNISNVNFEQMLIAGPSGAANGTGVNLTGLPGSSTFAVAFEFSKSIFNNLAISISYNSFVQGVTIDQCNFTGNGGTAINIPAAQTGTLSQLAVTNSQFNVANALTTNTNLGQLLFTNNLVILNANSTGLNLVNFNNAIITGNQFGGLSLTNSKGVILQTPSSGSVAAVTSNLFYGLNTGLSLAAATFGVNVSDNSFANNTTAISNSATAVTNRLVNNPGFNPVGPSNITVTASPFVYTAGASPETVYIFSGTVSQVNFDANGGALGVTGCVASPCSADLGPFEQLKVTYSVLPNMTKMVH